MVVPDYLPKLGADEWRYAYTAFTRAKTTLAVIRKAAGAWR